MAKSDFLPPRDTDFRDWLAQLSTNLPASKAALNVADADLAALAVDAAEFQARLDALNAASAAYDAAAQAKKASRAGIEGRVRPLVRRLKAAAGYTDALGAALRVIGVEDTTDLSAAKPALAAMPQPRGAVELTFAKHKTDGINLYSQRDGEAGYTFLARDTASPYVDNRPLLVAGKPETRKYKAVYVVGDDEVGQFSDEVTAVAQP